MRISSRIPLLLFATAAIGFGQSTTTPEEPVIRVNVELVQVDAVVTDSKGRHVPDLKPEDFELKVDGKPRAITNFNYVDTGPRSAPLSGKPRREDVRRTLVFIIDDLHTAPENIAQLIPVAKRFVNEMVVPGDLVSVMAGRNSMGIYEEFTSNKRRINEALDRLVRRIGQGDDKFDTPYFMEAYLGLTVTTLSRAVDGLRDMPGKKAILYFADGVNYPFSAGLPVLGKVTDSGPYQRMVRLTQDLITRANRSGVTFYTFDARGVVPGGPSAAQSSGPLQSFPYWLARETGGVFVHDNNAVDDALAKAMDDMTGYYLLGYRPEPEETASRRGEIPQRSVQIKVLRKGLSVRSRKGIGIEVVTPEEPKSREGQLRSSLFSPFDSGGIKVRLSPVYSGSPPDPKSKKRTSMLRALLAIDGKALKFEDAAGEKKKAILDVVVVAYDANNKIVGGKDQRYSIELTNAQASVVGTITYQLDVPVTKAGPYLLRSAVRDTISNRAGSATAFVQLPDFNKERVALSSLVLSDSLEQGDGNRSAREFKPGSRIYYVGELYGAKSDPVSGVPKLDVEVKLYREGKQVFGSKAIPINADPNTPEIIITGNIGLPDGFSAGEYEMELVVHDRLAGAKQQDVSQWIDLTVASKPQ